ncbi:MAG: hypothetical protein JW860_09370 [Sedimentisphaerales bacterium]|nr:hypothetical protein [Sedimentisphaerales bacterium]
MDWKKATAIIKPIIDAWDPYGLLASGAPDDEFAHEIYALINEIKNIKSPDDATLSVLRVFSHYFVPEDFTQENCRDVGIKLYKALKDAGFI